VKTSTPTVDAGTTTAAMQTEMPLRKIHHPVDAYTAEVKRSSPR
jgi:hypothetical protein